LVNARGGRRRLGPGDGLVSAGPIDPKHVATLAKPPLLSFDGLSVSEAHPPPAVRVEFG